MHIYTSRDYVTAFIDRNPSSLMVSPPFYPDQDTLLRLLNGSVNRYSIGLSLHLAGLTPSLNLPAPGWDWGQSYDTNVETGHRPSDALLSASRLPSTLFLILSAYAIFGIGWQFGGRLPAYLMSALYILNPVILMNGRRAMLEGSLFAFGLLIVWLAILIVKGRKNGYWWLLFTLVAGIALVSKQTGVVYVGGALGWIGLTELIRALISRSKSGFVTFGFTLIKLIASGIFMILIFIALSPSLWNDPLARFKDLVEQRQILLDIQVGGDPNAPTTIPQRIEGMITQPFLTAPQQYEVSFWAGAKAITDEVEQYMASPLSGLQFGIVGGLLLTLLAGVGIVATVGQWRSWQIGLLVWLAVVVASLLVNPLPWQRYYLPLLPVMTVLSGYGLYWLIEQFRQRARSSV